MQKFGGVGKSFAELIRNFHDDSTLGVEPFLTFKRSDNIYLQELSYLNLKKQKRFFEATGGLSTLLTLGPVRSVSSLWAGGISPKNSTHILHATYYRPTLLERLSADKLVVTIHDFIPEILGWTGVRNPHIGKRKMCRRADKIVSVSQVTTDQLVENYGISPEKIDTIHHGVRIKQEAERKQSKEVPSIPSVLYVGHRGGYKNFEVLIQATKLAISKNLSIRLLSAGPELSNAELIENKALLDSGVWKHFTAPNEELLGNLYKDATVHVLPSLMEGFGLTILESMSYGTPCLLSDIPIFHEVARKSAFYFQPNSAESLLSQLELMLNDEVYKSMCNTSLECAASNSWAFTAKKYAKMYIELAK
jgi:glycosyltransferase involved in cell wall biosynthesis